MKITRKFCRKNISIGVDLASGIDYSPYHPRDLDIESKIIRHILDPRTIELIFNKSFFIEDKYFSRLNMAMNNNLMKNPSKDNLKKTSVLFNDIMKEANNSSALFIPTNCRIGYSHIEGTEGFQELEDISKVGK